MEPVKLTYFTFKARGEASRLALDYANIKFEDFRYKDNEEFAPVKNTFPFHQLPLLELKDGTKIAQSYAILTYIGTISGTFPKDPLMAAYVNQALYCCEDLVRKIFDLKRFTEPGEEREKKFETTKANYPNMMKKFDQMVSKTGTKGYSVGDSITVADFQIFVLFELMKSSNIIDSISPEDELVKEIPSLFSIYENVISLPALQTRLSSYNS